MTPRVIQPLTPDEQAAFDLVELVIRRDMPVPLHVQIVKGYAQVIFGTPQILFTAGKTMAEAFEHSRAMWSRHK